MGDEHGVVVQCGSKLFKCTNQSVVARMTRDIGHLNDNQLHTLVERDFKNIEYKTVILNTHQIKYVFAYIIRKKWRQLKYSLNSFEFHYCIWQLKR